MKIKYIYKCKHCGSIYSVDINQEEKIRKEIEENMNTLADISLGISLVDNMDFWNIPKQAHHICKVGGSSLKIGVGEFTGIVLELDILPINE
jgi:hypothetical protein